MTRNSNGNGRERSAPATSSDEQMSLQQLLTLGQESARALQNQSVEIALQHAVRVLQDEWAETKPEEVKKREGLFLELQGLKRFYSSMTGFVAQAQGIADQQRQRELQQEQEYAQI
jgi:hypothetical protein